MEPARVIARYKAGRLVKGFTRDFNPNKAVFHISSDHKAGRADQERVDVNELKAIFFVRSFEGDPDFKERKSFIENDHQSGRKIEVIFTDNEVMQGSTLAYNPERLGFFLFPCDPKSNNIRVFVISSAVKSFRYL